MRELRAVGKNSYRELASHSAVVFFPYDLALFAFFEFYHAGMPIFLPDVDLLPFPLPSPTSLTSSDFLHGGLLAPASSGSFGSCGSLLFWGGFVFMFF